MASDILLLTHYPLTEGRSMAAYRQLLEQGLPELGYRVHRRTAGVRLGGLARRGSGLAKWLGYVDQFLLFPITLLWDQRRWPRDTCVLVSDQALGPWLPWIRRFPHLVICHDLLALRASRGEFSQQPVGWSGRLYQAWIRWGFRQATRFAAVSEASRSDLARELPVGHAPIGVLPNPLPATFVPLGQAEANACLEALAAGLSQRPYLLHVGGYWYKNREGVCAVFAELHRHRPELQLVLVGHLEDPARRWLAQHPPIAAAVRLLDAVDHDSLQALYSRAQALLFPSWLEGFGWPVLEAMACGCPVITTDRAPMREVGGEAAVYLPPCPARQEAQVLWAQAAAAQVAGLLNRSPEEQRHWRARGFAQAARFSREMWLERLSQLLPERPASTAVSLRST